MIRTDFEARIEQDRAGVITEWNAGAQGLFGWTRAEAIGQPSNMLIPARNRELHDQSLRTLLAASDGASHTRRVTSIHRDGHELLVEIALSTQTVSGVRRIVAIAQEIGVGQQMPTGLSLGPVRFDHGRTITSGEINATLSKAVPSCCPCVSLCVGADCGSGRGRG